MEAEKKDLQVQVEFLELQGKQLELKTKNYADQSECTSILTAHSFALCTVHATHLAVVGECPTVLLGHCESKSRPTPSQGLEKINQNNIYHL